jgi:hypothetical protein
MRLYFKDNFFNSGKTEILSENQEVELVSVIMGMHEIQKRQRASTNA